MFHLCCWSLPSWYWCHEDQTWHPGKLFFTITTSLHNITTGLHTRLSTSSYSISPLVMAPRYTIIFLLLEPFLTNIQLCNDIRLSNLFISLPCSSFSAISCLTRLGRSFSPNCSCSLNSPSTVRFSMRVLIDILDALFCSSKLHSLA